MKRARAFGFWGLSIISAASFVYACSSSSSSVTGGGSNGGGDATTGDDGSTYGGDDGSSTTDSGGSNKDGSTGDDGGTGPCGSTSSYNDCVTCCDGISDGGVTQFYTLQFECLCGPGKCNTKAKCKNTFCTDPSTPDAGAGCNACLDQNLADDAGDAGCQDPVFNECAADMGCAEGIECVINSACGDKP